MKFLFKAIIWPIKKILLFPIKLLFFIVFSLLVLIFIAQYRTDFDSDVSPLKGAEVEACTAVIDNTNLDALSAISLSEGPMARAVYKMENLMKMHIEPLLVKQEG